MVMMRMARVIWHYEAWSGDSECFQAPCRVGSTPKTMMTPRLTKNTVNWSRCCCCDTLPPPQSHLWSWNWHSYLWTCHQSNSHSWVVKYADELVIWQWAIFSILYWKTYIAAHHQTFAARWWRWPQLDPRPRTKLCTWATIKGESLMLQNAGTWKRDHLW